MMDSSAVSLQLPSSGDVHIVGAGPVGLMMTALLQGSGGFTVHLYEKRREYTRTRMVRLAPYLVADTVESYSDDHIDGETVAAVFDPSELERTLGFRRTIPDDLMSLLREWSQGFCPLNSIEQALSELIDARAPGAVERTCTVVSMDDAAGLLEQGDVLIDCTGASSLLRNQLLPDANGHSNTLSIRLEYALVVTFLYGQSYECNEFCKYFKNVDNVNYKFIPAVHRTYYDGAVSHVTGIVNINEEEYQAMPSRFDGAWLREHFPDVAVSMDRFIDQVKLETNGELLGDLEIVRIPLNLYHARNATNRRWLTAGSGEEALARSPVFLLGDSAIGSPYFQSISLGFENAMFLAGMLATPNLPLREAFDLYELHIYKQWLRVYMRSKMIKHNKDLFEHVDDKWALLERLHIY